MLRFQPAGTFKTPEDVLWLHGTRAGETFGEDTFGVGTSFGFRGIDSEGQVGFFSFNDESKPWFAAMWSSLGEFGHYLDSLSFVGDLWMWIWVFLSTVILVNLLVAMFSERYIDVSKRSHTENIVLRCRRVFIHDRIMLVTPPLLNLPYAIGFLGRFYWRRVQRKCASLDSTKQARERLATELTAKLVGQLQPNVERESKQYVEKFLDLEREREATSLQTLSTTTLDKLGVIETDLQLRHEREARSDTEGMGKLMEAMGVLTAKVEELQRQLATSPASGVAR